MRTGDRAGTELRLLLLGVTVTAVCLSVAGLASGATVRLRPDGLRWRDLAGAVYVPWEALAPGQPARPVLRASTLNLTYLRPDLVRQRGLVLDRHRMRLGDAPNWFMADIVRHYVDHPERRPAIGTEAEYRRLLHALAETAAAAPTDPPLVRR